MDRIPVSSSNLASVGYDPLTTTLEVEFLNGRIYQYSGIPMEVYVGLMNAPSKGSFFHHHVRQAGYPYTRVA